MPWTAEEAIEMGRKGGTASAEARAAKRDLSPEDQAREAMKSKSEDLARKLLDCALKRGDFSELDDPKLQMKAVELSLYYVLGRPVARSQEVPEEKATEGVGFE
jgi:hypothetical protein